VFISFVEGLAI